MTRVLVFTFRTFPHINELKTVFDDFFVFGELKKDLLAFHDIIKQKQPDLILGIARSTTPVSTFEPQAVNILHGRKISGKKENHALFIPCEFDFISPSSKQTTSFCNWVAYRLAEYLSETESKSKLALCHVATDDLKRFLEALKMHYLA